MISKGEGKKLIGSYSWFKDVDVIEDFVLAVDEISDQLPDEVNVLGIGSGVGNLEYAVKKLLEEKHNKKVNLTISDRIIKDIESSDEVNIIEIENKSMPFEDNSFDLVVARSVTHYEKDNASEGQVLCEVNRVLNDTGFFITEDVYIETDEKIKLISEIHSVVSKSINLKTYEDLIKIHKDYFDNVILAKRQPDKKLSVTKESFIKRYEVENQVTDKIVELINNYDSANVPDVWTDKDDFGFSVKYKILICKK